ncbi:thymosin beta-like [Oppia nitens]|uniref:thymosin beta-like n=1 Tax=Oppia nitens TaxID=1686743 RepID=UPI0023DC9A4A|nr:thymosin beta-like [Oppia nitens]
MAEHLPKPLTNPLKSALESEDHQLRHTETAEKVILPSAEDLTQERSQQALLASIESADKSRLKSTQTQEKVVLPSASDIATEKSA